MCQLGQSTKNRRQSDEALTLPKTAELTPTQRKIEEALLKTHSSDLGTDKDGALTLIKRKLDEVLKKDKVAADDLHKVVQDLDPTSPEFLNAIQGFQGQAMGARKVVHLSREEIKGMLGAVKDLNDPNSDFVKSLSELSRNEQEKIKKSMASTIYLKVGKILDEK